jgi:hypothetical protein
LSHASLVVQQFIAKKCIPVITQPPYSLDLGPITEAHVTTREDIKSNVMVELQKIPKEAFRQCFQQLQDQWNKGEGERVRERERV